MKQFIPVGRACFSTIHHPTEVIRGKDGNGPDRECSDPNWRLGPGFIEIDRLVLVGLDKVSKGSWQPRVGLLMV